MKVNVMGITSDSLTTNFRATLPDGFTRRLAPGHKRRLLNRTDYSVRPRMAIGKLLRSVFLLYFIIHIPITILFDAQVNSAQFSLISPLTQHLGCLL